MFKTLAVAAALLVSAPALAADVTSGPLTISQPTARPSLGPAKTSAAFFTVTNKGGEADRLLKAESTVAETVELHTHIREGDVMRMRPVPEIAVPANGAVSLEPGGLHVMLIGVKEPLKAGATFPLSLTFAKAGKVDVTVQVQAIGAAGQSTTGAQPAGGHSGHKH